MSNSITDALKALIEDQGEMVDVLPWPWESARWDELVFSVVFAHTGDAAASRAMAGLLDILELSSPDALSRLTSDVTARAIFDRLSRQVGLGPASSDLLTALTSIGARASEDHDGKIQRLLREESRAMRDRLITRMGLAPGDDRSSTAISLWLQNVAGLPIPLETLGVSAYLATRDISFEQLVAAADELDFNAALIDDLLADGALENGASGEDGV